MKPKFFPKQADFRKWLEKNHDKKTEFLVGFYKVDSGKPSMNWSQSVDEALCFGWIDGVRKSIDGISYTIRFTPRRPTSIWSAINIKKIKTLTIQGFMRPAGLTSFKHRKEHKSGIYAYENKPKKLPASLERKFKANKKAWTFFRSQAPSYQRVAFYWIMSAKQETTKMSRLERLINVSATGKRI